MSLGACPACCELCIGHHHDGDRTLVVVWGEVGQLGAMDDDGRMVCGVFWGCSFNGAGRFFCWTGDPEADKVRRGKAIGVDG